MLALFASFQLIAGPKDVVFLAVLLVIPALNIAGWWRFRKARTSVAAWRETVTLLGLLANAVAFLLPFVLLPLWTVIDLEYVVMGCLGLAAFALVASLVAMPRVRLPLLFGSLVVALLWLMIPRGVL